MRAALITGGGTGIGASAVKALVAQGVKVAVAGRRLQPLEETGAIPIVGDITRDAQRIVEEAVEQLGGELHVLVNNAGAIRRNVRLHELDIATWDEQIATNLSGHF